MLTSDELNLFQEYIKCKTEANNYYNSGNWQSALEQYHQAIQLSNKSQSNTNYLEFAQIHYHTALACRRLGQWQEQKRHAELAIEYYEQSGLILILTWDLLSLTLSLH